MTTKRLIIKMSVRFTILLAILIIVSIYTNGVLNTIIINELALGQMENSTEAFALMETYNGIIKPLVALGTSLITIAVVISTALDVYKFIKTKEKNENEKES